MRTEECLTCGQPFVPVPLHPVVESSWCDECLGKLDDVSAYEQQNRPNPVDLIAWAFMRRDAFIPNKATEDKARYAIESLNAEGYRIVRNGVEWRVDNEAKRATVDTTLGASKETPCEIG